MFKVIIEDLDKKLPEGCEATGMAKDLDRAIELAKRSFDDGVLFAGEVKVTGERVHLGDYTQINGKTISVSGVKRSDEG